MDNSERNWNIEYPFRWKFSPEELDLKIRSFIFSIIGVSAGLPALVWAVGELIEHRRNGHRISVFIILLLLTDFTELYLSPYIIIKAFLEEFLGCSDWTCCFVLSLSLSSRVCGLLLNQLVALEGILSVRYPLYTAAVFSSRCFIVFYTLVLLCLFICGHFWFHTNMTGTYDLVFPVPAFLVSVITWMISCGALCSAERRSHTSRKADPHIVVIFIITLLVLYVYLTALVFDWYISYATMLKVVYNFSSFLMSVRLISDPLLCVLVCRQNPRGLMYEDLR